uniref:Glycoside hydrolase family 3 C-terminal domain-containing protein n=1 Tax=Fagus sylvatica TaxID=28930 RepID=A0A2N9GS44_FAGSY
MGIALPKNASRILVAGSHANNLGYQCGGWTIAWQGLSGNNITAGTTILSAITTAVDHSSTEVVYSENPDGDFVKSNNFSYAIVIVGEHPYAESQGDSLNLTIADSVVAAWLPGSEGHGVADVLFGDYGFTGKLACTWFKTVDQLPMNVGDSHYDPLFPFGFGLTTEPVQA